MNATRAAVLGIIAFLVIACGAGMSVLLHLMNGVAKATNSIGDYGDNKYESLTRMENAPLWASGFVYIIPGFLAFIAAFAQNKCLYILSCIISMIAILLMGLIIVLLGMPVFLILVLFVTVNDQCQDFGDSCRCKIDHLEYKSVPFETCDIFSDFTYMGIGLASAVILAWVFLVAAFIIACFYACRSKTQQQGIVFTPAQQPMLKGEHAM